MASWWNPKARAWVKGRKGLFSRLETAINDDKPVIWMHCASLGEFEQGRPVLEGLKNSYPNHRILLTFFSPSGYEVRKNYEGADYIFYLPPDSSRNARKFISIVKPALAIFIKYEFWHYYLAELRENKVPTLLVSGIFRKGQPFFRFYGGFWRRMLDSFTRLFVQNQESMELLLLAGLGNKAERSGDTRFDRVLEIASAGEDIAQVRNFCAGHKVIVAGSTWIEDEEVLDHYARVHPQIRFILAPHEIHESRLKEIEKLFPETVRFSRLKDFSDPDYNAIPHVLIIDNFGMLSTLYKYAHITYVGGGFGGDGIHNILEAGVYGKPVVFGPVYDKFREAEEMIQAGGAVTVENALELESVLDDMLENDTLRAQKGMAARKYIEREAGATGCVLAYIQEKRLLTS